MTQSTDTAVDDITAEPLWMVCRKGVDVLVRWEDLTPEEQQDAILHPNQIYGVET